MSDLTLRSGHQSVDPKLLEILVCPLTKGPLIYDASRQELKAASGGDTVPTLVVGRSVHSGYSPDSYSALLDSARYPKPGAAPPRAQAAPPDPDEPKPEPAPTGPYAPKPRGY